MNAIKANQYHLFLSAPKPRSPNQRICGLQFRVIRACKSKNPVCNSSKISSPDHRHPHPPAATATATATATAAAARASSPSSLMAAHVAPTKSQAMEETVEKVIYQCRFVAFLGVFGSLIGAVLCFVKGCNIVAASFIDHLSRSGKAMVLLVEATDVYLLGTVMMIFGMGLYELFVSNLDIAKSLPDQEDRSNLFGLFTLVERPKWLEIKSVNELKTKVGHVIVMLLLIGLLDNSKKAAINTPTDLLCFSVSILLCSCGLYLLSRLNGSK